MINGKVFDWSSISINISGLEELQVQDISYDDELEKETVYGIGNKIRGYGTGNYKATAKLSMLKEDYDIIIEYCKKQNIPLYKLEIPKIVVAYANFGEKTKTDVIKDVTFSKLAHKGTQGDKSLKIDLDLLVYGEIIRDGLKAI